MSGTDTPEELELDPSDGRGDVVWMNTVPNQGWNQTITEFKFNDEIIISEDEQTTVVFETGYPYIGLSEKYFDKVKSHLQSEIDFLKCQKGPHWGLCYVEQNVCDEVYTRFNLTFTINDIEFKIPLENIAVHINHTSGGTWCQS